MLHNALRRSDSRSVGFVGKLRDPLQTSVSGLHMTERHNRVPTNCLIGCSGSGFPLLRSACGAHGVAAEQQPSMLNLHHLIDVLAHMDLHGPSLLESSVLQ